MLVRYYESASVFCVIQGLASKLTKINGPEACPRRQVDHPLRFLDRRQVQFPLQHPETHLVHHVQAIVFRFIIREQVS